MRKFFGDPSFSAEQFKMNSNLFTPNSGIFGNVPEGAASAILFKDLRGTDIGFFSYTLLLRIACGDQIKALS